VKDFDWKMVGGAGSIIGGIAVMHGLKTRKWRYIHTFGVLLGVVSTVAPIVRRARELRAELLSDPHEPDPASG
jgi:hypothetical protein